MAAFTFGSVVCKEKLDSFQVPATEPWKSTGAKEDVYLNGKWVRFRFTTYDTPAQIELCMNCPFSDDCHDCVSSGKPMQAMTVGSKIRVIASGTKSRKRRRKSD